MFELPGNIKTLSTKEIPRKLALMTECIARHVSRVAIGCYRILLRLLLQRTRNLSVGILLCEGRKIWSNWRASTSCNILSFTNQLVEQYSGITYPLVEKHESYGWKPRITDWTTWTICLQISRFSNPLVEAHWDWFAHSKLFANDVVHRLLSCWIHSKTLKQPFKESWESWGRNQIFETQLQHTEIPNKINSEVLRCLVNWFVDALQPRRTRTGGGATL